MNTSQTEPAIKITLPKPDPTTWAVPAPQNSQNHDPREFYPGVIVTKSVNCSGIDLPVPYEILFRDHIQSRLEPYALN